jgi:3-hydroxyisobutyryl-CoA hydrolase
MTAMSSLATDVSPEDDVIIEKINNKGVFTMNRPKVLNALSLSMIRKMTASLKQWKTDRSVDFVLIKGNGGKAFCCGGDLREITDGGGHAPNLVSEYYFYEEYTLDYMTSSVGVPWIALIDGITMGAGFGLSVHGQYRVATEKTVFAMPETAIGLFPDVGGGYFLPRLTGKLGMYLALTGARLRGEDIQKVGVATHFVNSSDLSNLERDLLSLKSPKSSDIEDVLISYQDKSTFDRNKPHCLHPYIDAINKSFAGKTVEEIVDNLQKENSEWSKKQLQTLGKMSPTSMKVTLRLLEEGLHVTLAQDLKTEHRLAQRFVRDKDLYEGVRAVVIDKDQNPQWVPSRLEDVTREKVDWYFSPLHGPNERELILDSDN